MNDVRETAPREAQQTDGLKPERAARVPATRPATHGRGTGLVPVEAWPCGLLWHRPPLAPPVPDIG